MKTIGPRYYLPGILGSPSLVLETEGTPLPPGQYMVWAALVSVPFYHGHPQTIQAIADACKRHKTYVWQVLNILEQKGFARRVGDKHTWGCWLPCGAVWHEEPNAVVEHTETLSTLNCHGGQEPVHPDN
jgi:hypothetical protein